MAETAERFAGADGFVQIGAVFAESLADACQDQIGQAGAPYGSGPRVDQIVVAGRDACLVTPGADQPAQYKGQAALIVAYPTPVTVNAQTYGYLLVLADLPHIRAIGASVSFTGTVPTSGPVGTTTPTAAVTPTPPRAATATSPAGTTRVRIFLIAIGDDGMAGPKVGCGDSVVAVQVEIPRTTQVLHAAFEKLLSIKDQYYGQSGLYNALWQSNLTVQSVTLVNGVATVRLSGTLQLGGVCDNPRVDAQLTQTALQFDTVTRVDIFIDDVPLAQVLSLR
jgi:hypothetical protein